MLEAVLSIDAPRDWKKRLVSKYHASVNIIECQPEGELGARAMVAITLDEAHTRMAIDDVEGDPNVVLADLAEVARGRVKGVVVTRECMPCCRLVEPEAFLIEASMDEEGRVSWRIIALNRPSITRVVLGLEGQGCDVELMKLGTLDAERLITSRQEEVLQIAFELGYFDFPKRVSLRDLAATFGVSISTLSEMLRKGQRGVMEEYFSKREGLRA